ncbi:MAG TPA: alpha/beta fold hydrolase, partial [Treponemataceae bacterium]|nr:alpha/beta fold hydrolase [Treponemataceae bacterium]
MTKKTVFEVMNDDTKVALHMWIPKGPVHTVVQISHGMAEHALRYDRLAEFLVKHGIAVYAHDHRGHGQTAKNKDALGFIAAKNGFTRVVEDVYTLLLKTKKDFPNAKIVLFGHSFGSFVAQSFIECYGLEIDACILCGTAGPNPLLAYAGKCLSGIISAIKGPRYRSKFLDFVSFGSYNNKIPHKQTKFDWLSRDNNEVEKYINSDYCGFLCSASFFNDISTGLARIHNK